MEKGKKRTRNYSLAFMLVLAEHNISSVPHKLTCLDEA